uniref:Cohesin subunit SCC3/SA HEAT-repeats domain-containing protein n=1 Tax=Compsopogon caeruleus TaxID=31354 RepID=A0A7S1T5P3_9RHOD
MLIHYPELMDESKAADLCKSIILEDDPKLRVAVGALVAQLLGESNPQDIASNRTNKLEKLRNAQVDSLLRMSRFLFQRTLTYNEVGGIVDALWDLVPSLRDWDVYIELILSGSSRGDSAIKSLSLSTRSGRSSRASSEGQCGKLSGSERVNLLFALALAARKIFEERERHSKKQGEEREWQRMSDIFARHLPALILEYQDDSIVREVLLDIPRLMDFRVYIFGSLEKELQGLLDCLRRLFDRHGSTPSTLSTIAHCLGHVARSENSIRALVESQLIQVDMSTFRSLHVALRAENIDRTDPVELSSAMARASHLVTQLPPSNLQNTCSDVITLVQALLDGSWALADADDLSHLRILIVSTFGWMVKDARDSPSEGKGAEILRFRSTLLNLLLGSELKYQALPVRCIFSSSAASLVSLSKLIPMQDPQITEGAVNEESMIKLRTSLESSLCDVYFTDETSLPDGLNYNRVFELRLLMLGSIAQLVLSQTCSPSIYHLPLVGLCDKALGETDTRIFQFSKSYFLEIRKRFPKILVDIIARGIVFASRFGSDREYCGTLLAHAVLQRFPLASQADRSEEIIRSLFEILLARGRHQPDSPSVFLHCCKPLIGRVCPERTAPLVAELERELLIHFPKSVLEEDRAWNGWRRFRDQLVSKDQKVTLTPKQSSRKRQAPWAERDRPPVVEYALRSQSKNNAVRELDFEVDGVESDRVGDEPTSPHVDERLSEVAEVAPRSRPRVLRMKLHDW